ncbi:DUF4865 family protein [Luteimonas aquatica]|uniref:DUF4865 family protein n=1 Tax=Luteimonas aquatica TaxID=450364 RepID=UPI001F569967|nr:DUF4865 family protein [Luteimonas aquatica]
MIAMQYSIALPADYDMDIVRRRIAQKGPQLDGFPGLSFKAYLYADRDDAALPTRGNLYAPFYAWREAAGMHAFLAGPGFAALTDAFGRPHVRTWSAWEANGTARLREAVCASRDLRALPVDADLGEIRTQALAQAHEDLANGALAAVSAFDPQTWSLVALRLWDRPRPDLARPLRQLYAVGHVSVSAAA